MIKPPSLQKTFTECFSEDPAFVQPPAAPADSASDEEKTAHKTAVAEYAAKLTAAWETGDWSTLRVEGAGEATAFTVKPLSTDTLGKIADMKSSGVGENELFTFAFRCALVSVAHLGEAKVTLVDDDRMGRIASLLFLEQAGITGGLGLRIVREIGARVLHRATSLPGK